MDNEAVSPVIGTILMVGITVILAATLWAVLSAFIPHYQPPDYTAQATSTPNTTPTTPTDESGGPNQTPENKEEKWSVEPLPGYECTEEPFGIRAYLCVRI